MGTGGVNGYAAKGPTTVPVHVWGLVVSLTAIMVLVVALLGRPLWVDELMVLEFTRQPADFLGHLHGSGHPAVWYLPVMAARIVSDSVPWLRLVAIFPIPIVAGLLCHEFVADTSRWLRTLLMVAPVAGLGLVLGYGSDLRPYGALTATAVLIATGLHCRDDRNGWTWAIAVLGLLSVTHLTGLVLAGWFALVALWRHRPGVRTILLPAGGALVAVALAWVPGATDTQEMAGTITFAWSDYGGWITSGLSRAEPIAGGLAAIWVASLFVGGNRTIWIFDLPAIGTLVTLGVASVAITPVVKYYTFMPALALLFAGALLRLAERRSWFLGAGALLLLNVIVHAPSAATEHEDWGASTAFLQSHSEEISCPVWAYPDNYLAVDTGDMVDGIDMVPFGEGGCGCGERWVIANHISQTEWDSLTDGLEVDVERAWPTALVGVTRC